MSDEKTKEVMDGLLTGARELADKLFVYGEATTEAHDPDGVFGTVEGLDGVPTRIYLFCQEQTERTVPNVFERKPK